MKKLLAITAIGLFAASSAAFAGEGTCYSAGQSLKSVSTVPTITPVPTKTTASTSQPKTGSGG